MDQTSLWHETLEDALGDVVRALGGPKKVGALLWPALPVEDAARKINHCLDRDKSNKLSADELLLILKEGRRIKCLTALAFINRACDCSDPIPTDPETETARLMRQYVEAQKLIVALGEKIEARMSESPMLRRVA